MLRYNKSSFILSHPEVSMAYIVVEGNIGAGKSTFLQVFSKYLNAQCVCEPHEQWQDIGGENLLEAFYQDGKRWAYTFQSYAFITRVMAQEAYAKTNTQPFQLIERSVFSDRYCFAKNAYEEGLMSKLEWELYKEWFDWFVTHRTQKPAGFIYLQTDPEVCFDRMCKRNRTEESAVPREYLTRLHDKHEEWLITQNDIASYLHDIPVLVLDCNEGFEGNRVIQQQHVEQIATFLENNFSLSAKETLLPQVTI